MKKLWSKLIALMLGVTMALGVGFAISSNSSKAIPVHAASATYEVTASNLTGWTSTQGSQTGTSGGFTIESNNAANNTQIRLYSGGTHTFTSTVGNITKAVFTCTANGTNNYGPGKMSGTGYTASSGKTGTWEGNATSFTLTGGQSRVTSIVFTYDSSVTTYTISYDANGGSGTMSQTTGANPAVATCTFTAPSGQQFKEWNTADDGSGTKYTAGDTPGKNLNLYAIWEATPTPTATAKRYYSLVTSTDSLLAGAKYIIVGHTTVEPYDYYAMSTTQNTNNRGQEGITVSETVASVDSDAVEVITLGGSTGAWTFGVDGGYLYAASSSKNYLRTQETNDSNGEWSISITSEGVVTATAQGSNSHNLLQYNSSSSIFSAYANAQRDIYLYRLDFEETLLGNVSCSTGSPSFPDGYTWNTDLADVYNDLPASEKSSLASKSADVNSGLERYDYIIGKYNPQGLATSTDYNHFITGRTIHPLGSSRIILNSIIGDSTNVTTVVIVTSMISLSVLALFLFLKKRRYN